MKTFLTSKFKMLFCGLMAVAASSCSPALINESGVEDGYPTLTNKKKSVTFGMQATLVSMTQTRADAPSPPVLLVVDEQPDGETAIYTRGIATETDVDDKKALESLTLPLLYGSHKLHFLVAEQPYDHFDEEAFVVTWNSSKANLCGCWAKTVTLTVSESVPEEQSVTLPIQVACIAISINDAIIEKAKRIKLELTKATWQFDLKSMAGVEATTTHIEYTIPNESVGKTKQSFGIYTFIPTDREDAGTMTATAFDKDEQAIISHEMEEVPVQTGHYTNYSGNFFKGEQGFTLNLNNSWIKDDFNY